MNPSPSLVAIDIGNSRTNIALFESGALIKSDFLPSSAEYLERLCNTAEKWRSQSPFEYVVAASVVPALGDLMNTLVENQLGITPIMVEDFKTELMPLRVDRPETVGVDRVVNCYAAAHLYGCPAIVVSLGTATTFEAISPDGEYLGGAIAPGVKISLEALTQKTALLPPAIWKKPKDIIAKNTLGHMQSGIYYGTVSLIEGMVKRLKTQLGENTLVIGTGGISSAIAEENLFDHHDPTLLMKGLALIYRRRYQERQP